MGSRRNQTRIPPGNRPPPIPSFFPYAPHLFLPPRFPNLLDLVLVALLLGLSFICAGGVTALALHFHLFGVSTVQDALTDIHYTLGSQVAWYCFTFLGCLLIFPRIWHTGFFRAWSGAPVPRSACAGSSSAPPLPASSSPLSTAS